MITIQSYLNNPILISNPANDWEANAVFNGGVIKNENGYHLVYRAVGKDNRSTIGIARGEDKHDFGSRRQLIIPQYDWEKYGCEDPRVTKIDDQYFIFYTAISDPVPGPGSIKEAVAISDDLITIKEKHLVTPFNAKAMVLFPKKISGKYVALLTVNTDRPPSKMALASFDRIEEMWSDDYWQKWYRNLDEHTLDLTRLTSDQVEVGAVPVETETGWLLIYSHIQNYYRQNEKIFGVEAVLLDLDDPTQVVARTREPLMVPQESYELEGLIPEVIFPSGSLVENDRLYIYYGATDTSCAVASVNLTELLKEMKSKNRGLIPKLIRNIHNPIITPDASHPWEARSTFNPAAVELAGKIYIIYRAMSMDNTSVLGLAVSGNGETIEERLPEPIYQPRYDFEMKKIIGGNSGCEDPRVSLIGSRIYLCYTAFNGVDPPRIALTSILVSDFVNRKWNWKRPTLISNPKGDNKDACIIPDKIADKYIFFHREGGEGMVMDTVDDLEFENNEWLTGQLCIPPRIKMWDSEKIGVAAPPLKTEKGWLLLYHGMSNRDYQYRVGAILLDLDDPSIVIGRSEYPLLEAKMNYEKNGDVPNVVFPCGAVIRGDKLLVYYGGGDKVVGVATGKVDEIMADLG